MDISSELENGKRIAMMMFWSTWIHKVSMPKFWMGLENTKHIQNFISKHLLWNLLYLIIC